MMNMSLSQCLDVVEQLLTTVAITLKFQSTGISLSADDEKKLVSEVFTNAMGSLSEEDRNLPQVEAVLPLLKRGIGIHHGGLLPILKETIEILFSEGLIKVLH